MLRQSDYDVRQRSAEALGKIGPAASPYATQLVAGLHDRDEEVRHRAAESFCELGMVAVPHGTALLAARKDGSERVRDMATFDGDPPTEILFYLGAFKNCRTVPEAKGTTKNK